MAVEFLAISFLAATAPVAAATEVWVITDRTHPVSGHADRHILLDAPPQLEVELADGLPPDPGAAAAIVRQRLKQGGVDLQRRIAAAYQGVADAWSLGITKVPAVVVDRRYVVYGETDVARAVARIEQHRREQP
ncbi:MAG: TIGR03757 family integrating conjugative element protein [Thauera propionica]|nr:TIGR03757 family integrating conjugative element protein [Thauera propionica]MDD3673881.1 TIGR03757 family integrating conjugative element protein [Thauera propionica]MDX9716892.1 TIGR03757 family integrating conjugative element protein [Thauera sp.]